MTPFDLARRRTTRLACALAVSASLALQPLALAPRPALAAPAVAGVGGIMVTIRDVEAGPLTDDPRTNQPQAGSTLRGAEFEVVNASGAAVTYKGVSYANGEVIDTIRTNDYGQASTASTGAEGVPFGTYRVRQTKAPLRGYKISNPSWVAELTVDEQDVVEHTVTDNEVVRGGLSVRKVDADGLSGAEGDATLAGATFEVYNVGTNGHGNGYAAWNRSESRWVENTTVAMIEAGDEEDFADCLFCTITTDASGVAATGASDLPYGSYYVRESGAAEGYLVSSEGACVVDVHAAGAVTPAAQAVKEQVIRGSIDLFKYDAENRQVTGGRGVAQGAATFAGATYTVTNASTKGQSVIVGGRTFASGSVIATLTTDESGYARLDDLPYGTYRVRETAAPEGYVLSTAEYAVSVREDGAVAHVNDGAGPGGGAGLPEQVIRADVRFAKKIAGGMYPLAGSPFTLKADSTGETHRLVTDDNGLVDTSGTQANGAHRTRTNANDNAAAGFEDRLSGVWFSGGTSAPASDSLGALPYDWYTLDEVRAEANEDVELLHGLRLHVTRHGITYDYGTLDDTELEPARPASIEIASEPAAGTEVSAGDEISYTISWQGSADRRVRKLAIYDAIPQGTTYVDGSVEGGAAFDEALGAVVFGTDELAKGERGSVSFKVKVKGGLYEGTTIDNQASWRVGEVRSSLPTLPEGPLAEQLGGVSHPVKGAPELSCAVTATPAAGTAVVYGDTIAYVGEARNAGTGTAHAVTLSSTVPEGTELVEGSLSEGASVSGRTVTWAVGDLAPETSASVGYSVRVGADAKSSVLCELSCDSDDEAATPALSLVGAGLAAATSGESASAEHPVGTVELAVAKSASAAGKAVRGSVVSYTVSVTNTGQATARDVEVADELPAGLRYVDGTARLGGELVAQGASPVTRVVATIAELAPGESTTLAFNATVVGETGSVVANRATATAPGGGAVTSEAAALEVMRGAETWARVEAPAASAIDAGEAYEVTVRFGNSGDEAGELAEQRITVSGDEGALVAGELPQGVTAQRSEDGTLTLVMAARSLAAGEEGFVSVPLRGAARGVATLSWDGGSKALRVRAAEPFVRASVPEALAAGERGQITLTYGNAGDAAGATEPATVTIAPATGVVEVGEAADPLRREETGGSVTLALPAMAVEPGSSTTLSVDVTGVAAGTASATGACGDKEIAVGEAGAYVRVALPEGGEAEVGQALAATVTYGNTSSATVTAGPAEVLVSDGSVVAAGELADAVTSAPDGDGLRLTARARELAPGETASVAVPLVVAGEGTATISYGEDSSTIVALARRAEATVTLPAGERVIGEDVSVSVTARNDTDAPARVAETVTLEGAGALAAPEEAPEGWAWQAGEDGAATLTLARRLEAGESLTTAFSLTAAAAGTVRLAHGDDESEVEIRQASGTYATWGLKDVSALVGDTIEIPLAYGNRANDADTVEDSVLVTDEDGAIGAGELPSGVTFEGGRIALSARVGASESVRAVVPLLAKAKGVATLAHGAQTMTITVREPTVSDGALALEGPREASVGEAVTYVMRLANDTDEDASVRYQIFDDASAGAFSASDGDASGTVALRAHESFEQSLTGSFGAAGAHRMVARATVAATGETSEAALGVAVKAAGEQGKLALSLAFDRADARYAPGERATATITLTNGTDEAISAATLRYQLDGSIAYVSSSPEGAVSGGTTSAAATTAATTAATAATAAGAAGEAASAAAAGLAAAAGAATASAELAEGAYQVSASGGAKAVAPGTYDLVVAESAGAVSVEIASSDGTTERIELGGGKDLAKEGVALAEGQSLTVAGGSLTLVDATYNARLLPGSTYVVGDASGQIRRAGTYAATSVPAAGDADGSSEVSSLYVYDGAETKPSNVIEIAGGKTVEVTFEAGQRVTLYGPRVDLELKRTAASAPAATVAADGQEQATQATQATQPTQAQAASVKGQAASWQVTLAPGATQTFKVVMRLADDAKGTLTNVATLAGADGKAMTVSFGGADVSEASHKIAVAADAADKESISLKTGVGLPAYLAAGSGAAAAAGAALWAHGRADGAPSRRRRRRRR